MYRYSFRLFIKDLFCTFYYNKLSSKRSYQKSLILSSLSTDFAVTDGKVEKIKMMTEEIDDRNKSATYKTIEGELLKFYKTFKFILQVTPREEGSLVHWSFEFEKMNANIPNPESTLPAVVHACKDIDVHLTQQPNAQRSPRLQCY